MLKKVITITSFAVLALALPVNIQAATLSVPSQYPTIQAAIDASSDGDVISVSAGIYNEALNLLGKEIIVEGAGPGISILDGTLLNDSVVTANSGEGTNTVLQNFTIQNGEGKILGSTRWGGAIFVNNSSPAFNNLSIDSNTATYGSGIAFYSNSFSEMSGIYLTNNSGNSVIEINEFSNITMSSSTISDNSATFTLLSHFISGASYQNVIIENNINSVSSLLSISFNDGNDFNPDFPVIIDSSVIRNNIITGRGLDLPQSGKLVIQKSEFSKNESQATLIYFGTSYLDINNSTFADNQNNDTNFASVVTNGGYEDTFYNFAINIKNSIFWNNSGPSGSVITNPTSGLAPISLNFNIIEGGYSQGAGNLNTDPFFWDSLIGNYSLLSNSPAIDAGDPTSPIDPDGTRTDMGAYPFFQIPSPEDHIQDLIDLVESLNLQQGINNSLDAKLNTALGALDDINENNDQAAINSLQAFINAVEAQRGIQITNEQADILIQAGEAIIDLVNL